MLTSVLHLSKNQDMMASAGTDSKGKGMNKESEETSLTGIPLRMWVALLNWKSLCCVHLKLQAAMPLQSVDHQEGRVE